MKELVANLLGNATTDEHPQIRPIVEQVDLSVEYERVLEKAIS